MPQVVANGIKLCYEITGDGPTTVVWTHGIGSSHHYWDGALPEFSGFRHVSYDVRGMGESEGTDGAVSLELWAADLNALLEEIGVDRAIFAGHSMGGAITQRFAIDYPQKVQGLLLLSTSSRVGPAASEFWLGQADQTEADGKPRLAAAQRAVAARVERAVGLAGRIWTIVRRAVVALLRAVDHSVAAAFDAAVRVAAVA